jgi:precorrin-6A/cobalt-precorrin-6A reductase
MIWIIGGTSNANDIAQLLVEKNQRVVISVTTGYGRELVEKLGCDVIQDVLDAEKMQLFIEKHEVSLIIDASHPFATEVSKTAMEIASQCQLKYIRFERPTPVFEKARYVESYEAAVDYLKNTQGNVLITTGSKFCGKYCTLNMERLFVRVLSTPESVGQCTKAGYKPYQIVTMTGVLSVQENLKFMRENDIRFLVTKDSGSEGGLPEKIAAAEAGGAEVLIISRPRLQYPVVFSDYNELAELV